MESQSGEVSGSKKKIWSLTEDHLILLLSFLCAAILILLLVVAVLACCLCVTRRKYNVERSVNVYNSTSSLDGVSTVESHRGGVAPQKGYSAYD